MTSPVPPAHRLWKRWRAPWRDTREVVPTFKPNPVGLDECMLKFPGKLCGSGLLCLAAHLALAQQYSISTVAGGAPPATPVPGVNISIGQPSRVAADGNGN